MKRLVNRDDGVDSVGGVVSDSDGGAAGMEVGWSYVMMLV